MTDATAPHDDERLFRAYVGSKADYYLARWVDLRKDNSTSAGFNRAAFFLSGFWLCYRKMYVSATILFGLILIESLAEELLLHRVLSFPELSSLLTPVISIAVAIVVGRFGNRWYYRDASRMVAKAKNAFPTEDARIQFLSKRGGGSVAAAIAGSVLFLSVLMGIGFVLYPDHVDQKIDFGDNYEVYFSGDATESDARLLGALLTESGFFGTSEAASVRIERVSDQATTVAFVVIEGAWNDPETLRYFGELGSQLADAGLGRPLTITLCNRYFEPQESVSVE